LSSPLKALGVSAAVYAAKSIIQSLITITAWQRDLCCRQRMLPPGRCHIIHCPREKSPSAMRHFVKVLWPLFCLIRFISPMSDDHFTNSHHSTLYCWRKTRLFHESFSRFFRSGLPPLTTTPTRTGSCVNRFFTFGCTLLVICSVSSQSVQWVKMSVKWSSSLCRTASIGYKKHPIVNFKQHFIIDRPRTIAWTVSSELLGFRVYLFPCFFVSGPCARLSWPCRSAFERMLI